MSAGRRIAGLLDRRGRLSYVRAMIAFQKMHGLGNDFVVLDHRTVNRPLDDALIRRICDRRFGIGCDQLIVMEPSEKADVFMRIYNPDGSQSEACGNATRCIAHLVMKEAGTQACTVETLAGLLSCRMQPGDLVEVDMGPPHLEWHAVPLAEECDTLNLKIRQAWLKDPVAVGMGNPHCVFFVKDAEILNLPKIGPPLENHPLFPNRTNVEFAQVRKDGSIRLRVWERGAGVTLACGSGACATIVAAVRRGLIKTRKARIDMDGGALDMEWREQDGHVLMTGPAAYVFAGDFSL